MSKARLPVVATVSVITLTLMAGCIGPGIPNEERRPEIVGVVDGVEFEAGRVTTFDLLDGRTLQVDLADTKRLIGGQPTEGELLLYGTGPNGAWIVGVRGTDECYKLSGPGEVRGERMVLLSGLSLPLGDEFARETFAEGISEGGHVCVSAVGEVTEAS